MNHRADIPTGKRLHDVVSEAIQSLEAHVHDLPALLADRMHTVKQALRHPQTALQSISGFSAHELSTGMQHLRDGFEHSLSAVHASMADNLHALQLSVSGIHGDEHLWSLQHAADEVKHWVQTVVRKSVMWPVVRWPLYVYMVGAMTCLLTSATCHLLGSSNFKMHSFIWRLDYAGAVLSPTSSSAR